MRRLGREGLSMKDKLLSSTNIPAQFRRVTFSDYDEERGHPTYIKRVRTWEPDVEQPSLLLVGHPGLAKTMLACATLNEFQSLHVQMPKRELPPKAQICWRQQRYPVYFIQIAEWIQMQIRFFQLHAQLERGLLTDPDEYLAIDKLLEDLKHNVQMLVLDDIGKEHRTASGFAEDAFDLLVRTRGNAGLATIFTTNLPLDSWAAQYSQSMRSFIERTSKVIGFKKMACGGEG